MPVGDVQTRNRQGKVFPDILSDRHVERGVLRQMIARKWIAGRAVGKARTIIYVGRGEKLPGERGLESKIQSIPLVMIEEEITLVRRTKIGQAAGDGAAALRHLIG